MPIGFRAASATDTAGVATPTAAIPLPSGWQPGDLHLLVINLKSSTVTVTTPTGWTAEANSNITGGAGTVGVDAGPNRVAVFWRIADVGDTAPTVTLSATPNAYQARILGFTKAANEAWDTPLFSGAGDTTGSATSYGTVTGNVTLPLQTGDWLGQATGLNGDAGTPGTRTFAAPGVTLGTYAAHVADVATTQGGDLRYDIGTAPYGSGTATGAPTLARTWTTGSASLAGATVFWRLRTQVPLPYTYDFTGTTGAAWAEEWTTTPGVTIQSNAGQLVTPAASYQSRSAHLAKMTSTADVDIRLTVSFAVVTEFYFAVNVRSPDGVMSGGDPLYSPFVNDGMLALFMNDGNVELDRCVAGVRTGLTGVNIVSGGLVSGTAYTVRFQAVGTTMRAKIWVAGTTEPSTWVQFVDSSAVTSAGRVVIGYASGSAATAMTATVDDLSVEPGVLGPPSGTATGSWQFTGTASGKRAPQATAAGTWAFTGAASGKRTPQATATGSWQFAGTAAGKRVPKGSATGAWSFSGAAAGKRTPKASSTGTWSFVGTAAGQRTPKASAAGSWAFAGTATGQRTPKAAATGTWTFTGTAVGSAPSTVVPADVLVIGSAGGLNHFAVQVAPNGAGSIATHTQAEIEAGYDEDPYFTVTPDDLRVQFWARADGPTTAGATTARSELREVNSDGTDAAWNANTGVHEMHGRTTITHFPTADPEVVVAQLHNGTTDRISIRTQLISGVPKLLFRINGTSSGLPRFSENYSVGTEFEWKIRVDNGAISIFYNDMVTPIHTASAGTLAATTGITTWYWKAGCYNQFDATSAGSSTEYGSVELRDLSVIYQAAVPSGSGSGAWSFTGTASGTTTRQGSATGAWAFTGAAAGKRTPKGTATGTWTFAGAAAGVAPTKVAAFVEHFNTANSSVWSGWSANIGVSNGRASLLASSSYNVLSTIGTYDLTNSSLTGEFSRFAGKGSSVETYLGVFTDAGDQVAFHGDGNNNLSFDVYTGGTPNNTYEGVGLMAKHRIWRIRESAGTIYWETGPDGLNWTVWRSMATPFNVSSVHVFLKVGYWDPADAPNVTVPALVEGINLTYAQPSTPRTFYVDTAGSDTADGSSTTPWATLARAQQVPLYPGDTIALKRGGTWAETFYFIAEATSSAPITLTAYGSGAQPIIAGGGSATTPIGVRRPLEVYGSYLTIDDVEVQGSSDYDIYVYAPDTTVQNCTVRWGSYGILQDASAPRIRILDNTIVDVKGIVTPPGDNDDTGAMGILLAGDSPVVAGNYISGCFGASPDYLEDGAAIEIYGAANAEIYNNVAIDCCTFCEIGLVGSDNNVIHHNLFRSSRIGSGVVCNGTAAYGPVLGTVFHHNTVVITGGVHQCHGCYVAPGANLDFRNNIIVVTGNGFQISAFDTITEAGNVLYGDSVRVTLPSGQSLSATDYFGNPQFVTPYTDLHLLTGSPAINRGVTGLGYTTDLDGAAIVGAPDSGAYEFAGANTGSAVGSWSFTGAAVGKRTPKATATGAWTVVGTAAGKRAPKAAAAGAWTFLGDATGRALLPPTGFTVTPVSVSQLNLSWNSVSGATGYDIERDGVVIVADHPTTTYSDTGLSESTAHTYRVRAAG